jgi:hypothetical protein
MPTGYDGAAGLGGQSAFQEVDQKNKIGVLCTENDEDIHQA